MHVKDFFSLPVVFMEMDFTFVECPVGQTIKIQGDFIHVDNLTVSKVVFLDLFFFTNSKNEGKFWPTVVRLL